MPRPKKMKPKKVVKPVDPWQAMVAENARKAQEQTKQAAIRNQQEMERRAANTRQAQEGERQAAIRNEAEMQRRAANTRKARGL